MKWSSPNGRVHVGKEGLRSEVEQLASTCTFWSIILPSPNIPLSPVFTISHSFTYIKFVNYIHMNKVDNKDSFSIVDIKNHYKFGGLKEEQIWYLTVLKVGIPLSQGQNERVGRATSVSEGSKGESILLLFQESISAPQSVASFVFHASKAASLLSLHLSLSFSDYIRQRSLLLRICVIALDPPK